MAVAWFTLIFFIFSGVFIKGKWLSIGSAARKNDKQQHIPIKNNKFVIISVLEDICNKQLSIKKLLLGRTNLSHIDVCFSFLCHWLNDIFLVYSHQFTITFLSKHMIVFLTLALATDPAVWSWMTVIKWGFIDLNTSSLSDPAPNWTHSSTAIEDANTRSSLVPINNNKLTALSSTTFQPFYSSQIPKENFLFV